VIIAELDLYGTFVRKVVDKVWWLTVTATSASLLTLTVPMGLGALYVLHLDGGLAVIVAPCDSLGRRTSCSL
jgi:hypothetical protein